jgi:integrase
VRIDEALAQIVVLEAFIGRPHVHPQPVGSLVSGASTGPVQQLGAEVLAEHLACYTAKSPEAYAFLSSQGRHPRRSNLNRRVWQPATRAAGVEGLRVHDLRHTAGTLATAAGGSLREVMDRLGHSTTVAAVRYQHVMADRDAAIARELNRLIEGG